MHSAWARKQAEIGPGGEDQARDFGTAGHQVPLVHSAASTNVKSSIKRAGVYRTNVRRDEKILEKNLPLATALRALCDETTATAPKIPGTAPCIGPAFPLTLAMLTVLRMRWVLRLSRAHSAQCRLRAPTVFG